MKILKRILIGVGIVLVVGVLGLAVWGNDAYQPTDVALAALQSDVQVNVTEQNGFIVFAPTDETPKTGFVFYPGGRVDFRAYSPALRRISEAGYLVSVVKVPINFAFLDINAANKVIDQFPEIEHWAVGGHSLGGVAASSFASGNLDKVQGLVLWASYPANDALKDTAIKVVSIYGTNDMAGMEPFQKSKSLLPPTTQFVVIDGGNHAQFGAYGPQGGDNAAGIPMEEQWAKAVDATVSLLASLSK